MERKFKIIVTDSRNQSRNIDSAAHELEEYVLGHGGSDFSVGNVSIAQGAEAGQLFTVYAVTCSWL